MKKFLLLTLLTVLILTGCTSKSSFSTTFDRFTFDFYTNNKEYIALPLDTSVIGMSILTKMKEITGTGYTGFLSSLIIIKTTIQSWADIKTIVDSNAKNTQLRLFNYVAITNAKKKVKCGNLQYSWYITTFSYQLDNQTLYVGQYFFTDNESLYLMSLSSDDKQDIKSFTQSIGTIKCIK